MGASWMRILTNLSLLWLGNCCTTATDRCLERNNGGAAFVNSSSNYERFSPPSLTTLRSTSAWNSLRDGPSSNSNGAIIRTYLGRGPSALVREGCVLVAPSHEYHHLLMKAAIFIYAIGINDVNERVARGVIIDHPTAFSVEEMIDGSILEGVQDKLGKNTLFRGGDLGEDVVMMLHSHTNNDSDQEMIGSSGLYEGGLSHIVDATKTGKITDPVNSVKFFFNYLEFTEQQLDFMFSDDAKETTEVGNRIKGDSDGWASVEVCPSFVLRGTYDRGSAWEILRNQVRQLLLANRDKDKKS